MKTLEELKAAMDAAKAKAEAAPENKDLKAFADAAEAEYKAKLEEGNGGGDDEGDFDEAKADAKTKAYIAKLRKENASHRTGNKDLKSKLSASEAQKKAILKAAGIEDESEDPAEQVKTKNQEIANLAFRSAILESAVQNGIGKDDLEFYEFLITSATNKLQEGEELSEEALKEIVGKVQKAGKGSANTSVGGKKPNPDSNNSDAVTLEKFCMMGITAKSALYTKNPDQYAALVAEAKAKKRLI